MKMKSRDNRKILSKKLFVLAFVKEVLFYKDFAVF